MVVSEKIITFAVFLRALIIYEGQTEAVLVGEKEIGFSMDRGTQRQ